MSAASVAAKARDPDRIAHDSPEPVAYEDDKANAAQGSDGKTGTAAGHEDKSANDGPSQRSLATESSLGTESSSAFKNHVSLPPEILGLYSRSTREQEEKSRSHSRNTSLSKHPEETTDMESGSGLTEAKSSGALEGPGLSDGVGTNGIPAEPVDHRIAEPVWNPATIDSCPVIVLPKNFQAKEGTSLTDDLIVGKHISSGLQGGVYDLKNLDGSKANMVFKIVHPHAPLAEVEREWEVGMRLNQLAEEDGSLPGFMGVGAGIRGNGKFRGMLLERLNGTTVDKVICTRDFHDVHYVYSMLYSIFTALDRAQGALGFHHSDLRLANVMEIFLPDRADTGTQETATERALSANVDELEKAGQQETQDHSNLVREKLRHQFKIIDYGLANFDETFAAGPDVVVDDDAASLGGASKKSLHAGGSRRSLQMRQNSISPATGCVAVFPFPVMKKEKLGDLPNTSPLEKLYRFMWRRKGDVYHLVFELGEWLDGRVWPSGDELDVLRLVDFIEHVTGVRMKFWFSDDMTGEDSVGGWRDRAMGPFERHESAFHFLRRYSIRLRSWINPSNPGLTAAEALTAPFFTKRISLRGTIRGCSTLYSRWTRGPKKGKKQPPGARRVVKRSKSQFRKLPSAQHPAAQ